MKMKEFWRSKSDPLATLVISCLLNLSFCWCLNHEGEALLRFKEKVESDPHGALLSWRDEVGFESPCSWFGVECSQGRVVSLNLKDLCLRGTLATEIGNLANVKSIILRNNSFSGAIPEEIADLKELEVLDLGYNNFSGRFPVWLGNNFSMSILLLDNNELLSSTRPKIYELRELSEVQVGEDLLSSTTKALSCDELLLPGNYKETQDVARRKLSQEPHFAQRRALRFFFFPSPAPESIVQNAPAPALAPAPGATPAPASASEPIALSPSPSSIGVGFSPAEGPTAPTEHSRKNNHRLLIVSAATGGSILLLLIVGIYFWQSGKVATVKPWATGLSGQLQRAFVTGVPKLKRSELEAACEDFSNVIGSSSLCTLYKGTLSSGVEIAVASIAVASAKEWSNNMEAQFRNKIETLSKVNHKNFVSLLGYCAEDEPFTRMMVFEYAPNGTLFEHLHIREAEHLNWETRLRITMGVAYCLEYMHQMNPPLAHRNFNSSAVYLTEDYAAKVSDFVFLDEGSTSESEPTLQHNVYNFGVVLFEMITGKLPYSSGNDSLHNWASDYLSGQEMADPTLETYQEDQLRRIVDVIKSCVDPDLRNISTMSEVCARLREITGIEPDGSIPRVSPLWWAELEILSTEAS